MIITRRNPWIPAALLVGAIYCVIGRVFTLPFDNWRLARVAAWVLSLAFFAAHVVYEHFRLRSTPRQTGLHTALAVWIGAAGLAIGGMLHALLTASPVRPVWLIAFFVLPVVVAIPAFVGGLLAGVLLSRVSLPQRNRA